MKDTVTRSPARTRTARRCALEAAQFCGDLVVAFRKVWKREVARGAGVRRAVGDTPNRQANARQRRHRSGRRSNRPPLPVDCAAAEAASAQEHQGRSEQQFHGSTRRCISLHRAERLVVPYCASCAQPARAADSHASRWLACWCSARQPSDAQPAVRQVLVLQSFDRGNLVIDHFTGNFRVELDQRAGEPVNVVQVVVGPTGFVGAPEQAVVDYIRSTFADRPKPDLIVTVAGPAAVFARKYRQQLFPDTPLLFASVDRAISRRRAAWRERDRRRGRQRFSADSSMTSCSCCPRPGRCSW